MKEERPWGNFDVIHEGDGFKVKILEVSPGMRLSYQSHEHRSERWVIVQGSARIILDGKVIDLGIGQMIEIGAGQKHRIENPSTGILRIVEVQIGDYLGEDDITRYEDDHGRV